MDYLDNLLAEVRQQTTLIPDLVDREVMLRKSEIIKLNIQQIDQHEGADGKLLENDNKIYKGVYAEATEAFAAAGGLFAPPALAPKKAGQPYNWVWTGDFIQNFDVEKFGQDYKVFSTGTGSGDKKAFFDGYKHLFGLTTDNELFILNEVALFVMNQMIEKIYKQ